MSQKMIRWLHRLWPIGLILLTGLIVFIPFAGRLGFYRDDWYMLWSANVRGAASIIDLFSIDRPFMGYTYSLTYRLLGDSPVPWQIYAFVLKTIGAIAVYGIMLLLLPEHKRAAATAGLLYLVYPGFLGQPNAGTMTNQLLSLTAVLGSIWFSGLAVRDEHRGRRAGLILAAVLLGLLNFLLYEYMIGLEVLRLCVLWFLPQQTSRLVTRQRLRRLWGDWWPYLASGLVFLVWRLGFFKSGREGTDQFSIIQTLFDNVRTTVVRFALEMVIDPLQALFLAWGVPFEKYASQEKFRSLATALIVAAAIVVIALVGLWLAGRLRAEAEQETGRHRLLSVFITGLVGLLGALLPVLAVGRDIDFNGGFDRYTLHASPAMAILLSGFLFGSIRGRARQVVLGVLLFLGAATHVLNAYHWERVWQDEKTLWWQLWWRAPGFYDQTILLASIPEGGFFEDYEIWGPANLIYRPQVETVTIGAEILNIDTVWEVWSGLTEIRGMRELEYERDYQKSLLLYLPSDGSCLKVVDRSDILLPLRYDASLIPILEFSSADQIDLSADRIVPPGAIFGAEPSHDWCFYYQSAELAKQAGDWEQVTRLGDEAIVAGLSPIERAEWLPFLEGYLWAGNEEDAHYVVEQISADAPLVRQICNVVEHEQYRFGEAIQQSLNQTLCP